VEKLRVYLGDRKKLELADVEELVCPIRGSQPWDLADAMAQRDLVKSLRVLNRLLDQKTAGVYIMAILEARFKEFLVYREAMDRGWLRTGGAGRASPWELPEEMALQVGQILGKDPRTLPGFIVNQRVRQASAFKKNEILRIQRRLLEAHRMLVTGVAEEQWVLEMMLIRILRRPAPRPA
jgi:DNA polymerase III delta subunit